MQEQIHQHATNQTRSQLNALGLMGVAGGTFGVLATLSLLTGGLLRHFYKESDIGKEVMNYGGIIPAGIGAGLSVLLMSTVIYKLLPPPHKAVDYLFLISGCIFSPTLAALFPLIAINDLYNSKEISSAMVTCAAASGVSAFAATTSLLFRAYRYGRKTDNSERTQLLNR